MSAGREEAGVSKSEGGSEGSTAIDSGLDLGRLSNCVDSAGKGGIYPAQNGGTIAV